MSQKSIGRASKISCREGNEWSYGKDSPSTTNICGVGPKPGAAEADTLASMHTFVHYRYQVDLPIFNHFTHSKFYTFLNMLFTSVYLYTLTVNQNYKIIA
uniref:Uncharacterized protein n=1 Tax=Homalodisca liturata TaxID=320908 RepID=A0A1B6HIJ1_9HEMI